MNIVIFEDNANHQMFLANTIKEYVNKRKLKASFELMTSDIAEIEWYIENNQIHTLYFIDIMDIKNQPIGLSIAEKVKKKNNADIIVFVTQYMKEIIYSSEHKILAFNVITKNNKTIKNEIWSTVEYAYSKMPDENSLIINSPNGDIFKVAYNDVYMIETVKGYHRVRIYYKNGVYECAGLLKEIELKLDEKRFKRCHRSFIVNFDKIEQIRNKQGEILLNNGITVQYSRRYKLDRGGF